MYFSLKNFKLPENFSVNSDLYLLNVRYTIRIGIIQLQLWMYEFGQNTFQKTLWSFEVSFEINLFTHFTVFEKHRWISQTIEVAFSYFLN